MEESQHKHFKYLLSFFIFVKKKCYIRHAASGNTCSLPTLVQKNHVSENEIDRFFL